MQYVRSWFKKKKQEKEIKNEKRKYGTFNILVIKFNMVYGVSLLDKT